MSGAEPEHSTGLEVEQGDGRLLSVVAVGHPRQVSEDPLDPGVVPQRRILPVDNPPSLEFSF